jgi:hypothetical protein
MAYKRGLNLMPGSLSKQSAPLQGFPPYIIIGIIKENLRIFMEKSKNN